MEHDLRKIVLLNQLIQCPVDHLPLHRSAVCGTEYKLIICKFRPEEFFEFFNLFLTRDQHFSNCFRQEYFSDTPHERSSLSGSGFLPPRRGSHPRQCGYMAAARGPSAASAQPARPHAHTHTAGQEPQIQYFL